MTMPNCYMKKRCSTKRILINDYKFLFEMTIAMLSKLKKLLKLTASSDIGLGNVCNNCQTCLFPLNFFSANYMKFKDRFQLLP